MSFAQNFSLIDLEELALRKAMQRQEYIIHRGDKRFYDFRRTNPTDWANASFVLDKEMVTGKAKNSSFAGTIAKPENAL